MTYCASCGARVEPSTDARRGWDHVRPPKYEHRVPFVVSEKQRDRLFAEASA